MYKNLETLRKQQGQTQAEFAETLGMAANTYRNYEKKIREPNSDFWIAVAEKYKVSVDYLMGFCDDPHGTKYPDGFAVNAEEKSLVTAWRKADDKAKEHVAIELRDYGFDYRKKDSPAAVS